MKEITLKMTVAWDAVQGAVYQTVYQFHGRYGGDLEDLMDEAQEAGLEACLTHDPGEATHRSWIRRKVWWKLHDHRRKNRRRNRRRVDLKDTETYLQRHNVDWRDGLSEDASHLADLVIHPPLDVRMNAAAGKESSRRNAVRALVTYLGDCGWRPHRIRRAINELSGQVGNDPDSAKQ